MTKLGKKIKAYAGVYKIVEKSTNKRYIGSTKNVRQRIQQHFGNSGTYFKNKDVKNYTIEVLEYTSEIERLREKEYFWIIQEVSALSDFYNKRHPVTLDSISLLQMQNVYYLQKYGYPINVKK